MIHDHDIERLAQVEDRYQAADGLGLLLYSRHGPRLAEFRQAFLDGLEAYETGHWVRARGSGPLATGNNLAAVWSERR